MLTQQERQMHDLFDLHQAAWILALLIAWVCRIRHEDPDAPS